MFAVHYYVRLKEKELLLPWNPYRSYDLIVRFGFNIALSQTTIDNHCSI